MKKKVLVVATSRKTRGGITSVIKAHERGWQWKLFHCHWVETHRDKGAMVKLAYLAKGFAEYLTLLPFYDIVHVHLSEPPSACRKLPLVWMANLLKKKTIVHFHAFSPETTFRSRYKKVYQRLFSMADVLIVLSPTWEQSVKETFPGLTNIRVVYNPCTAEILPMQYPKRQQILFAGTLNARKGYADMIRAFAKIASMYPDWQVVFAGNGEVEHGKALAASLGISSQTVFLGWVNGTDKDKAFKEASIFCLPSYAEGFPMAVLDAWAYGLPVITTPVGGLPDIAENGKNVLFFPPGDIDSLAKCLKKMINDEVFRTSISKESLKFSSDLFAVDVINNQIGEMYKDLCKNIKNNLLNRF